MPLPHTPHASKPLRSDARENRDRVLEAARALFARAGLGVTMRDIARHAGVGPATLYRRFPTKQSLILEAFMEELRACRSIVLDSAADPDPGRGFRSMVERLTVLNTRNRGFTDAFLTAHPDAVDFRAHRAEMTRVVAGVVRRAKAAGALRPDFTLGDVNLILLAGRGLTAIEEAPTATAGATSAAVARRLAELLLTGASAG